MDFFFYLLNFSVLKTREYPYLILVTASFTPLALHCVMLMLHQQSHWNVIYRMPTVEDLSSEQNFIAHWMSNNSRAGVLLDPHFTGLKINTENLLPGPENITAFPSEVQHLLDSCSVSEDSLNEEQLLESGSSCALQQNSTETSFPATAYNVGSSKADFSHSEMDAQNKSNCNDPLLQKLEQVINKFKKF